MNIVNLQEDVYLSLLSWDLLAKVNVVQQRKLRLANMLDFNSIYQTPRNGAAGIGVLVEMPSFEMSNNLSGPGPQTVLLVTLLVVECPPINLTPETGTGTDAESVAELLLPFLHQWLIEGQGEMYPQGNPIVPANDVPPGCIGYRVALKLQHSPLGLARVTQPSITIDEEFAVTLADGSGLPDVDTFYTLDESPPCPANVAATKYTSPFLTVVGDVVRWQAWKAGYCPSTVGRATITA